MCPCNFLLRKSARFNSVSYSMICLAHSSQSGDLGRTSLDEVSFKNLWNALLSAFPANKKALSQRVGQLGRDFIFTLPQVQLLSNLVEDVTAKAERANMLIRYAESYSFHF